MPTTDTIAVLYSLPVPQDRADWLLYITAAKQAGLSADEVDRWSRGGAKYQPNEVHSRWNDLQTRQNISIGWLVNRCKELGVQPAPTARARARADAGAGAGAGSYQPRRNDQPSVSNRPPPACVECGEVQALASYLVDGLCYNCRVASQPQPDIAGALAALERITAAHAPVAVKPPDMPSVANESAPDGITPEPAYAVGEPLPPLDKSLLVSCQRCGGRFDAHNIIAGLCGICNPVPVPVPAPA